MVGWNERSKIPADQLLIISTDGGNMDFCICPEVPGKLVVLHERDLTRPEFFTELDNLLVHNLGFSWIVGSHGAGLRSRRALSHWPPRRPHRPGKGGRQAPRRGHGYWRKLTDSAIAGMRV